MEELPIGVERHSVGATHRRSLGRSSRGAPIIPNLPPSLSAMGALWRDEGNPEALASELKLRRVIDVQEAFIDATFAPAKRGLEIQMVVHDAPRNLIGDNPYDSDKLDDELNVMALK